MREADEKVEGVLGDFDVIARLVVEGAEGGGDGLVLEELGVEVGDGAGGDVFDAEVGVTGALVFAIGIGGNGAGERGVGIEGCEEGVLEVAGGFVDAAVLVGGGVGFAHGEADLVGSIKDGVADELVGGVLGVEGDDFSVAGALDDGGEGVAVAGHLGEFGQGVGFFDGAKEPSQSEGDENSEGPPDCFHWWFIAWWRLQNNGEILVNKKLLGFVSHLE